MVQITGGTFNIMVHNTHLTVAPVITSLFSPSSGAKQPVCLYLCHYMVVVIQETRSHTEILSETFSHIPSCCFMGLKITLFISISTVLHIFLLKMNLVFFFT